MALLKDEVRMKGLAQGTHYSASGEARTMNNSMLRRILYTTEPLLSSVLKLVIHSWHELEGSFSCYRLHVIC